MMGKRIGNFVHTQDWNDFVYTEIQQKNKQLKEDKARLQQENKNLSKEIEELRVQNGNFEQLQEENKLLKNQNSGLQQTIAFLQKQLAIQEAQIDKLTKEGQRKQNDIDALQNSVQQLTLKNQKLLDKGGALNHNMHTPLSQNNELLAKIHESHDASKQQDAATQTGFESEKEDEKEEAKEEDKKDQPQTQHSQINMDGVEIFEEKHTEEYYKDKMKEQKRKTRTKEQQINKGKGRNNADQWDDDEYTIKRIYGGNKAQYNNGGYRKRKPGFDNGYQ